MTVGELIKLLKLFEPTDQVVLQKDAEGNGFSPLAGAEEGTYFPTNTWSGEVPHPEDVEEMDEDQKKNAVACVVLWPVN